MAVEENADVIQVELEADVYTLKRTNAGGVRLYLGDSKEPVPPQISGAKVSEESDLTILGRGLGKVDAEKCTLKLGGDDEVNATLSTLTDAVSVWYPPGNVKHVHSMAEFDELRNSSEILVGKFSAEWCGPCKMVAPAIDAMSLKYSDVTFVHCDEAEVGGLFKRAGIKAYPTFKFYKNGTPLGHVVQGADAAKVEQQVKKMGAKAAESNETAPKPEGEIKFVCQREVIKLEKTSSGMTFSLNGKQQAKCPRVEIDPESKNVTFGRGGGKVWSEGGYDLAALANKLKEWFPTKVEHIHSTEQFDKIVAKGVTVAKFSAEWCGPCKAIAGDYIQMSLKNESVSFLHIDVDKQKALSSREGIEAMPTFHFFKDGQKRSELMVRGANLAAVKKNLKTLGVSMD